MHSEVMGTSAAPAASFETTAAKTMLEDHRNQFLAKPVVMET
jgi:hypothetical protein